MLLLFDHPLCYLLKSYLDFLGNLVRLWGNLVIFNFKFFLINKEVIGPFLFFVFFTTVNLSFSTSYRDRTVSVTNL